MRRYDSADQELHQVTHELQHVINEEKHEGRSDTRRRGYQQRRRELSERLDRLLWFLVDEADHAQWHEYVRGGARPPELPPSLPPLLFKGRAQGGSEMEIRRIEDGKEQVVIDGSVEHGRPAPLSSGGTRQLGTRLYYEVFDAPEAAQAALREFLTVPRTAPPFQWARALTLDGIIDATFGLTERGRRLWRRRGAESRPGAEAR